VNRVQTFCRDCPVVFESIYKVGGTVIGGHKDSQRPWLEYHTHNSVFLAVCTHFFLFGIEGHHEYNIISY
jgi:hypothetical protein